jgi:hypothetical protein
MKLSQKQRILNYLLINKTITSLECVYQLNIVDLQHSIMELRKEGYKITDIWKKGEYNKYKEYRLEE